MHILITSWGQVWPNLVASLFPSGAVVVSHIKRVRQAEQHHRELKAHITGAVVSTAWMKPEKPGPRD